MKRLLALALLLGLGSFLSPTPHAQQWVPGGQGSPIVCAFNNTPPTISTGNFIYAQCNTQGELITSGGGGGSFTGFTPTPSYATGTTSAIDQNVALPTGTEFILTNTGSNTLAWNYGTTATGSNNVLQPSSWIAFAGTTGTAFHYIEATGAGGTTTFSISGGSGIPTGAGGGTASGGGGGLSVQDNTTFTRGTSQMTPSGCQYNPAETTLTSGAQGTVECNSFGQQFFDVNNNSNFATILASTVDSANNNKTATAVNVTPGNCSGSITTGGTAQNITGLGTATIHGFTIMNIDTGHSDEPLWISFTTTAAALTSASFPLAAPTATTFVGAGSYTTPPGFGSNHAVSIIGATTGHIWSCTSW